jgi:hypothetical protein
MIGLMMGHSGQPLSDPKEDLALPKNNISPLTRSRKLWATKIDQCSAEA